MSRYRRSCLPGGTFFFTVALAERSSSLLVDHIERLLATYRLVSGRHALEPIAICVLPDHLHAVWQMPADDAD
jgi:putative transposase